jgi:hypothetical protein
VILAAAAIPVLIQASSIDLTVIAALGASVAVVQGLATLFRLHDNWINYRTAAEMIRRETFLFEAGAGKYSDPAAAAPLLVQRIEAIAFKEHQAWLMAADEGDAPTVGGNAQTGKST